MIFFKKIVISAKRKNKRFYGKIVNAQKEYAIIYNRCLLHKRTYS
ncbi:hypothetical protein D920_01468 [Enterococcus faecalis 13-SD-W-01]|nr:hypothetical protein D920_01468 [Enterococcus faecalis 13-SD-W-01]